MYCLQILFRWPEKSFLSLDCVHPHDCTCMCRIADIDCVLDKEICTQELHGHMHSVTNGLRIHSSSWVLYI